MLFLYPSASSCQDLRRYIYHDRTSDNESSYLQPSSFALRSVQITNMQERHFQAQALAVLLLAASLFLIKLGDRSLWGSEGRWSEVTREMQLTQNYFWPTINGRVYYDKPLLSY